MCILKIFCLFVIGSVRLFNDDRLRNATTCTLTVILLYFMVHIIREMYVNNMREYAYNNCKHSSHTDSEKIDWHDHKLIYEDMKREGLGENGLPAIINLTKGEADLKKIVYSVNGYNGALSDKIALNRSLPDVRHPKCGQKTYLATLPAVSIIVTFHDEHLSVLLRTVHSVLIRSPKNLIKEVLLIDDASTKHFLKKKLDIYLKKYMPKVKVIRLAKRSGLMVARVTGAKQATAEVLVFLDSHTEANVNWLPPLLEPIALNPRTVTCPIIDFIEQDTFEYRAQIPGRGVFDWKFNYQRLPMLPKDRENMPEPFDNPVMCGGLFAISRSFFWERGGYDTKLDIWGGEQYELSFKTWQCGGRLVDVPCSRVGHVYRKFKPRDIQRGDFKGKNFRRVAEVWMDEYAEYLYLRHPHYLSIDPGDISRQKALRQKLKCKSFKWYMTHIAFDLLSKFSPIPLEPFGEGRVRSEFYPHMCIDAHHADEKDKLHIKTCTGLKNAEQYFIFSQYKDVRSKLRTICWKLYDFSIRSPIRLYRCEVGNSKQVWRYNMDTKQISHRGGNTSKLCIDWDLATCDLFVNSCNLRSVTQRWTIEKVNVKRLAYWDRTPAPVTGPVEA